MTLVLAYSAVILSFASGLLALGLFNSWPLLYEPIAQGINTMATVVGRIQTGNIRTYLGYSFATLILMLWVIS